MSPPHTSSRLTVAVSAFNSAQRLPALIAQARECDAEVLVGVDAGSTDETWVVATQLADIVYRFAHTGSAVPARLLPFRFARTPWILSLDDDEWMEPEMPAVLAELTARADLTHAYFPRKWLVNADPLRYVREPPMFPDWQLRLFRNDRSLVTRPMRFHAGYRAMGTGIFDPRASILHLDPLLRNHAERAAKIDTYIRFGDRDGVDAFYRPMTGRVTAETRAIVVGPPRPRRDAIRHDDILPVRPWDAQPEWRAEIRVEMPRTHAAHAPLFAHVEARNTGTLSWIRNADIWPVLNLGYHVRDAAGRLVQFDPARFHASGRVAPGELARWICPVAPLDPGDYILEWDLVSEGECWFAACGSPTTSTPVRISESGFEMGVARRRRE